VPAPAAQADLTEAGALAGAGCAAVRALDAVDAKPAESLLVVGATGGVGSLAVELAARRGISVVATARSGADAEMLTELAADAARGDIRVPVTGRFSFDELPEAIAAFRAGARGKLAVRIQ